ncbi:MAG TPA: hypothetical protein VD927_14670, partial [Chryseosolibacter sp.]|nr:hypothetical protein [Chryseosolibacter sp.]
MNTLTRFKFLILCGSLCLLLTIASQFARKNDKIETLIAPRGLLSLQGERDADRAIAITGGWTAQQQLLALEGIAWDNYLVFAYCGFLALCVYYRSARQSSRRICIAAFFFLAVAGVADLTENYFLRLLISKADVSFLRFAAIAGYIKWIGIGLTFTCLLWTFRGAPYLRWLFKGLTLYAAGIITVCLLYFVLIKLVQGQDVVMQIAEYSGPASFTALCVILFSIFAWYSSRIVSEVKKQQPENVLPTHLLRHMPRLIAYNAVVCIQAAAWALPTIGNFTTYDLMIFVIGQNVLYVVIIHYFSESPHKAVCRAVIFICVVTYGTFAAVMAFSDLLRHQRLLPAIAFVLFVYSIVMVYLFIRRRVWLQRAATVKGTMIKQASWFSPVYPREVPPEEVKSFVFFHYAVALGMILYFSAFIVPTIPDRMGALAFTVLALGVIVGVSNIISTISIKRKINFFLIILLVAFAWGFVYDYYKITLIKKEDLSKRPLLQNYFDAWINEPSRAAVLDDNSVKEFTVYVVIADGGASRSGYWVASVLSAIQDSSMRDENIRTKFSDHLLCLAGASGGSVGNAAFYHQLKNRNGSDTASFLSNARNFLRQDFLTPVLTRWLGSDILQHLVPTYMDNRAEALEKSMERFSSNSLGEGFETSFSRQVSDTSGRLPILFINSTHVQSGSPAVVSSIRLDGFSERLDVITLTDSL